MTELLESRHPASPAHNLLTQAGTLTVSIACDANEIDQALRLRYRVFADELGARIKSQAGIDRDIFDAYCEHVVVRDTARDEVVGTYRVLLPNRARALGQLYCDDEFWLTRLNPIRDALVELGRSCVHPDYRSGGVIMLLWTGIAELLSRTDCHYLIGCASVSIRDGGAVAANLYRQLAATHLADESLRVWPRERLAIEDHAPAGPVAVPALVKGYLRAGASLLGEPHRDSEFVCADFPLLLQVDRLSRRYQRRFMT